MGGETKPFTWVALFRDGHSIEQSAADPQLAFSTLLAYMLGTPENPKRHYLLWFRITDGDRHFTVSFDRDGDAYIDTPDGKMLMTEFKIRSAQLLYRREFDRATRQTIYLLGFGGINTCGEMDGKCIEIADDGSYKMASGSLAEHAMMKI